MIKKKQPSPEWAGIPPKGSGQTDTLRQQAENVSREIAASSAKNVEILSPEEARQLVHELRVHQIELTIQNEEMRRAQEELEASRARYFDLYDLAPVGYFTISEKGLILEANLTAANMLGVARSALVKHPLTSFILSADQDVYYQHRKLLFETAAPQLCELRMQRAGATPFWVRTDATLAQDVDGASICHTVMVDINERKHMEESLRESELKHRLLFDSAGDAIFIHDMDARMLAVNRLATERTGYTQAELMSMTADQIDTPEEAPHVPDRIARLMEHGRLTFETVHQCKDGSPVPTEVSARWITWDGQPAIMSICRDITARKQAEGAMRESAERMRKALGATVQAIAGIVETRDPYTAGHQRRVAHLSRAIATEMKLPADRIDGIRMASAIHDLGKISVPAEILSTPKKLSALEFSLIKTHAQSGHDILKDIEFPWPVARMIREHHERMDGSGYPRALIGEETLLESRILAVADVVESMASHRPYRAALGLDAALAEIENNKGTLYDADAVDACLKIFREKGYKLD